MNLNLGSKTIADFITFCTTNNLDHSPSGAGHVAKLGGGYTLYCDNTSWYIQFDGSITAYAG